MNPSSTRYCRCGTRLGQYHQRPLCNPCEKKLAALRLAPPEVPDGFWDTEQLRQAFTAQHIGQVSRAYRRHPHHIARYGKDGISQEVVGGWLGLTQTQISRIENGPSVRHLDSLTHWARTLRIPEHLLWFRLPGDQLTHERTRDAGQAAVSRLTPTRKLADLHSPPAPSVPVVGAALLPGDDHMAAMNSFRAADRQVGGGHLYATVVKYLHTEVAPRLFGGEHEGDGQLSFTAAAALTEMAGWMAHDAGRDRAAERHFARSLDLVKIGGDRQLAAHVLASLSHLAHHLGRPDEAIQYALRGRDALAAGPRQPELIARLLAKQARGFAALGQQQECVQLLLQAETALTTAPAAESSPWVSQFDEGSLASEVARCLLQLGDHREAQRQAERIIALRPGDRMRSRAFGQLTLVTVLIAQERPDEACTLAQEVLDGTQQLGSYLVIAQLLDLQQLLAPYRATKVVVDFLLHLEEALRERNGLYQWLGQG